jgi:mono/diheme cytochrome c family protein
MPGPISRWRTVLLTVIVAYGVVILGGLGFIYSGIYDIGADSPHSGLVARVLETARVRSIQAHAARIVAPARLDDQSSLLMGTEHFADHCAVCHGAPGVPKGDIANGLYPHPPDLAHVSTQFGGAELFWIIQHGIKMTGMPSWADHTDDELWATVAFLRKLPGMTPEDYAKLVIQNRSHSGHPQPGQTPHADKDHEQPAEHPEHEHRH